jgi:3-oxoacyl-[acyl-carrier protein] reductase
VTGGDPAPAGRRAGRQRGPAGPLAGRVALVTGVSRRVGIGMAVARRLAGLGAGLFVTSWTEHDREQPWGADPGGVDAVLAELRASVGSEETRPDRARRVEHLEADFLDPEAPERVMAAAVEAFGHLDMLVCNHARSSSDGLGQVSAAELDASFAVNTRAVLLLVQAFAAQHDGRPGGRVVLFTSGQHLGPMPGELAYAASKGALVEVTASLADALADRGITVNTINPGPTDTAYVDQELRERVAGMFPAGRWGAPDDAARLVAWLCTDDARWITGQVINSEGGFRRFR